MLQHYEADRAAPTTGKDKLPLLKNYITVRISAKLILSAGLGYVVLLGPILLFTKNIVDQNADAWIRSLQASVLPRLKESDYYAIREKVEQLKETQLFSSMIVWDSQPKVVAAFPDTHADSSSLPTQAVPIIDREHGETWGYYSYERDYHVVYRYMLISATLALLFFILTFYLARSMLTLLASSRRATINEAIARTTQMLAHDVRKPFSMLKIVMDRIESGRTAEEMRGVTAKAIPEVRRVMRTVDGLLADIMEIGAHGSSLREVRSPDELLGQSLDEVFRAHPEAKMSFHYDLQHTSQIVVAPLKILRVFGNILTNAVQATGGQGLLTFTTREVSLPAGPFVEFSLANDGPAIPDRDRRELFEAFT